MFKLLSYYGKSEKGRRPQNEDNFLVERNKYNFLIAAVADGMGGHLGGRIASSFTIKFIKDFYENIDFTNKNVDEIQEILLQSIKFVSKQLKKMAAENFDLSDMGTTLNLNIFISNYLYTLNIGDSRATQFLNNKVHQISEDQNLAALAKTQKDFKKYDNFTNFLTSCLGPNKETKIAITRTILREHGIILITSDGIHNYVNETSLTSILIKTSSLKLKTIELLNLAFKNNSNDNMTSIMVEYDN